MTLTKCFLMIAALLWAFGSWAQHTSENPVALTSRSATVSDVKGEVTVTPAQGAPIAAYKSQVLPGNTTIETKKGSVLLVLSDGSQVLLNGNTRVVLRVPEESEGRLLEQLIGRIIAKIQKRIGNEPPFRMGTPSAVITVRGTRFLVEVTKKQHTFVQVYEGLVEVDGLGPTRRPVYLQPGYTTQVGLNSMPDTPRNTSGELTGENIDSRSPGRTSERDSEGRTTHPTPNPSGHESPD